MGTFSAGQGPHYMNMNISFNSGVRLMNSIEFIILIIEREEESRFYKDVNCYITSRTSLLAL